MTRAAPGRRRLARIVPCAAALAWSLAACSPPMNVTLPRDRFPGPDGAGPGYRFDNLAGGEDANQFFVCLAFSGGGTRAAALAYGAMLALRQARTDWPNEGESVLDEVDCISSVSGGSFTAAYYGLFPDRFFDDFERKFLYRNIQGKLLLAGASPWNWPWLWSPYYSRIDLAAATYDDHVFDHKRYDDLVATGRRPFIILNATNVGAETRFSFTQDQFDLIGSDLGPYPVARGVAASSAFPFLLSPLALYNHQPLEGFTLPREYERHPENYYANRSRYYWIENQRAYVEKHLPYVHLLDGGLADNIGLRSIVDAYEHTNGFIAKHLGSMQRLAIITVNARTQSTDDIDECAATPHIIPTVAMATATTAMDNYSFDTVDFADRLMTDLRAERRIAQEQPGVNFRVPYPYVMEISFEAIADPKVRDDFFGIGTNFGLPDEQVKALINRGCELLKADPVFRCMLEDIEREKAGHLGTTSSCEEDNPDFHPRAAEQIHCPDPGDWPKS
jgi:NTE family protein